MRSSCAAYKNAHEAIRYLPKARVLQAFFVHVLGLRKRGCTLDRSGPGGIFVECTNRVAHPAELHVTVRSSCRITMRPEELPLSIVCELGWIKLAELRVGEFADALLQPIYLRRRRLNTPGSAHLSLPCGRGRRILTKRRALQHQ